MPVEELSDEVNSSAHGQEAIGANDMDGIEVVVSGAGSGGSSVGSLGRLAMEANDGCEILLTGRNGERVPTKYQKYE